MGWEWACYYLLWMQLLQLAMTDVDTHRLRAPLILRSGGAHAEHPIPQAHRARTGARQRPAINGGTGIGLIDYSTWDGITCSSPPTSYECWRRQSTAINRVHCGSSTSTSRTSSSQHQASPSARVSAERHTHTIRAALSLPSQSKPPRKVIGEAGAQTGLLKAKAA